MITSNGILYIEPTKNTSVEPITDEATRKMTAALRLGVPGIRYRGFHTCVCGAHSTNCDFTLPNGEQTNSLSIHYLAYHRDEIPKEQLQKVLELECGEVDPTFEEMRAGMKTEMSQEIYQEYKPKLI